MHMDTPSPESMIYLFIYLFIHSFIHSFMYSCWIHRKGALLHMGKSNSPSTEPQADGSLTRKWVRPCSPCRHLTTLLSLPQCHAALSTIHSTLAWIDQSPVRRRVPYNTHLCKPSTTVTASHVTQGRLQHCFLIARSRAGSGLCFQI